MAASILNGRFSPAGSTSPYSPSSFPALADCLLCCALSVDRSASMLPSQQFASLSARRSGNSNKCLLGRPCPALDRHMLQLSHNHHGTRGISRGPSTTKPLHRPPALALVVARNALLLIHHAIVPNVVSWTKRYRSCFAPRIHLHFYFIHQQGRLSPTPRWST
jgi:hypothetical protein